MKLNNSLKLIFNYKIQLIYWIFQKNQLAYLKNYHMVGCEAIYLFVSHRTLYFHFNDAFLFQFDLTFDM
jgi:hypothetical protein